ncbi:MULTISPECIES: hypothetical protein [Geomicrobium]|uniref:Uncharacterized protein n=1 Tax=Geomicrobium sediminis TaxID=1347788 RepID=A0ABS2PFD9_9BACL|nr:MULTISPECIES: hypothetical protein [Geomicrobium]MBM7633696.1 hypothetical protein [Geomicrobium sediminis]
MLIHEQKRSEVEHALERLEQRMHRLEIQQCLDIELLLKRMYEREQR